MTEYRNAESTSLFLIKKMALTGNGSTKKLRPDTFHYSQYMGIETLPTARSSLEEILLNHQISQNIQQ